MDPLSNRLPYFDHLLAHLNQDDSKVSTLLDLNVHWGYWTDPLQADHSAHSVRAATDALSELCHSAAGICDGQKILDAGCGIGGALQLLNARFKNLHLTGINIDPRQIALANARVQASATNTIEFVTGDACELPFADASFDTVVAIECIFHFPSRERFFAEAHRVLQPGGRLVLSDFVMHGPTVPLLSALYLWYVSAIQKTYGKCRRALTVSGYRKLARGAQFDVLKIQDITRNTLPTYAVLKALAGEFGEWGKTFKKCNNFFEITARYGMIRYDILSFQKQKQS